MQPRISPPQGTLSAQRTLTLLRSIALHNRGGLRIVDLCRLTGMRRQTLHRLLQCLEYEALVVRNPRTRNYQLGARLYELGLSAAPSIKLEDVCRAHLRAVAAATGDLVFLNQRSGADAVCIDRHEGPDWTRAYTLDIGTRRPLGIGAGALAILSALPEQEMRDAIATNEEHLRTYDGLTARKLLRMVRESRSRGFAVHDGSTSGARALGIPLHGPEGDPIAAISVSASVPRLPESRWSEVVAMLQAKRKLIERALAKS